LLTAVELGGNRSGKTKLGAMCSVAWACGRDDAAVQAWGERNGLDLSAIPRRPGRVCASSLTGDLSRRVQRPALREFLPAGTEWRAQDHEFRVPGGGVIVCKTNDQGPRAYQGDSWDLFWSDEEHDESVFDEGVMRLVDRGGRGILTMTPLLGRTWVWQRFWEEPEERSAVYQLHAGDNPFLPAGHLEAVLSRFGPHERAARERGVFGSVGTLVYPGWDRSIHVVPDAPIPAEWPRYVVIDFGTRNPCAWLLAALSPDDRLFIYRAVYGSGLLLSAQVEAFKGILDVPWGSWEEAIADPEDAGSRLALVEEHDLYTIAADKAVRPGINAVSERLALQADGRPSLFVSDHPSLRPLVREVEGYVWARTAGEPDRPQKKNDHAMDAKRYLCQHLARGSFGVGAALG
jgi:phage terminase large subunit-like protein